MTLFLLDAIAVVGNVKSIVTHSCITMTAVNAAVVAIILGNVPLV